MKITLIGTLPPIKALSPYCYHLAYALSKKINLEFFSFKNIMPEFLYSGGTKEKKKYDLKSLNFKNIINWYNPITWIKAGIKAQGDIVHIQHWAIYASLIYCIILPIVKIRGKKIVVSIHNITPHTTDFKTMIVDKFLNRIIFPFCDAYIVHNQRNKEKLLELYKIEKKRIFITTHGAINPYQKIKNISIIDARKRLGIPIDKKVILFFGYIWAYKGLDYLLDSLIIIKDAVKDFVLIIAGQPLKDWSKYEEIININGLNNFIIKKLDYISDSEIESYFSSCDVVVLPYKKHPFDTHGGIGALAISFKKPIIVTDVGGLSEYIKDDRVLSLPNDSVDLAKKIILVLNDEKLKEKLSNDSYELSKSLSWDTIADKTIQIYNELN